MTAAIDITKEQRKTLLALLRRFIPGIAVWAYGSRVKWTARPNSDLDLVAFTTPAQSSLVSELKEALGESDLPFLVDFHIWDEVPERFHELIRKEYVALQEVEEKQLGGDTAGEWETRKLRECCDFNPSSIKSDWPYHSLRYIDISSVGEGIQTEPPKLFLRSEAPSRAQRLVSPGDSLLSTVRPNRRSMLWLGSVADDVVASTGFAVLRAKPGVIFPRYLYYTIFDQTFTDYLVTREKGAAYPAVSTADIGDSEIALPPLSEQKSIAHILGTLDDKIELNRRMNATLEAMARALFQSWFVDFDPVRAKLDGRKPAGLAAATAALFPAHFQDSPLGHIPQGWKVGSILQQASLLSGGTPKTDVAAYWNGGIPWASAKDVSQCGETFLISTERTITELGVEESSTKIIPALTTVVVARGATTGRLTMLGESMAMNQTCYGLRSNVGAPFALYCYARHFIDRLVQGGHGSIFDTITTSTFDATDVLIAPDGVLQAFDEQVTPLFKQINSNIHQSRTLATLRDTLIPLLLLGKLRVPNGQLPEEALV